MYSAVKEEQKLFTTKGLEGVEMEAKIFKEMAETLQDIKKSLAAGFAGPLRGPVADPAPDWWGGSGALRGPVADPGPDWWGGRVTIGRPHLGEAIRGPVADPAPWYLLDKAKLAQLKIRQLEMAMTELEKQIDFLKLERDLLKKEYKIK